MSPKERIVGLQRLARFENNLSRGILLVGMVVLILIVVANNAVPDIHWILAFLVALVGGKLIFMVIGKDLGWKGWPALGLEALALGGAGAMAVLGKLQVDRHDPRTFLVVVVMGILLLSARYIRWRANRLLEKEEAELESMSLR